MIPFLVQSIKVHGPRTMLTTAFFRLVQRRSMMLELLPLNDNGAMGPAKEDLLMCMFDGTDSSGGWTDV